MRGRKLAEDTRILCAAPEYLARKGIPKRPEDLPGHDFLAWANLSQRRLIHRDGTRAALDPSQMTCRTILDDGTSLRMATLAGAGLSVNSLWSVAQEIAAGRLVHILPEWWLDDASVLWLIYPRSNVLTPKVRCFMDFLLENLVPALRSSHPSKLVHRVSVGPEPGVPRS